MRIALALLVVGCTASESTTLSTDAGEVATPADDQPLPPKGITTLTSTSHSTAPIAYHGGWIVTWDLPVYFIYYGNWLDQSGNWGPYGTSAWLLEHVTSQLGGSSWFSINSDYGDAWGNRASNQVHFAGSAWDYYSRGSNLSGADVQAIVINAVERGWLPDDPWGQYYVLTSPDVYETGFCDHHCGWHTSMSWAQNGADKNRRLYGFIGNPMRCPNNCGVRDPSANGVPAGDAMASVLGHELAETVTDPHLDAWYSADGAENADHCAWDFGQEYTLTNGAVGNVAIGDRWYLIQQNWVPANPGYCAQGAW